MRNIKEFKVIEGPKGTYRCELDISVEEWQNILQDETLTTANYKNAIMAFYREPGHKATCKDLGLKYYADAKEGTKYNAWITKYSIAVSKKLNRFKILDNEGVERFYHIVINTGRYLDNGLFEWQLRDELVQAIEKLGWNKNFTWIPFYEEMAEKLLQFKDNRKPLLDILYQLGDKQVGYIKTDDGRHVHDVDPFTVLGTFNRSLTEENRLLFIKHFKDRLGIKASLPADFNGIPVLNPQLANFFWRENIDTDIQPLWELFESAMSDDRTAFINHMNACFLQKGIKWNITMGLYWIKPYQYIALDSRNREYLPKINIDVFKDKDLNAQSYMALLDDVHNKINNHSIVETSIPEISYNAWLKNYTTNDNNEQNTDMADLQEYIELLKENHNLVLTGAPGTGKTYLAKKIAEKMGELEDGKNFVQFHPSYDYTDFVEGLRPKNENGTVGFERKDGVFKAFCKRVLMDDFVENKDVFSGLNDDPKIWKVSLAGTGDNPIRKDCLDNGYIRIGWEMYGDEDFLEFANYTSGGKTILRAFQNEMQVGDIVVSCYGEYTTDAIGIVTGDYEYREDGGDMPRYRNVEWIVKNKKLNTKDLLGKRMTLSTIYKLKMSFQKLYDFINRELSQSLDKLPTSNKKSRVFIIDEINRGDLSKIFGELFFAIDPGYRGIKGKVMTQYQNLLDESDVFADGFYVPENVYIIATMNDIDRSVESMDFAMRRRFVWKEVKPKDGQVMLDKLGSNKEEATKKMECLNDKIAEKLGSAYQIGPAYFLKLKNGDFDKLWENNLAPPLREYLRGYRNAEKDFEEFEKAYRNPTE